MGLRMPNARGMSAWNVCWPISNSCFHTVAILLLSEEVQYELLRENEASKVPPGALRAYLYSSFNSSFEGKNQSLFPPPLKDRAITAAPVVHPVIIKSVLDLP